MPTIHSIKRTAGIAGQIQYTAVVEYEGEDRSTVTFVGSQFGGPVVMISNGAQVFVTNPSRFGKFSEGWVRNFLKEA